MKIYSFAFLWYIPVISGLLFQFFFAGNQPLELQQSSTPRGCAQIQKREPPAIANIVFKSTDGGQTWLDISQGLPANPEEGGFFADESGLYVQAGDGIYQNNPYSTPPSWKKAFFPGKPASIAPGKTGIYAYHYQGQILQKTNGTSVWSPTYTNFQGTVRTVFETAGGTLFIGSDNGLFKSTNSGKTWKHVFAGGWVIKMAASDGVLLATSMSGILRSADAGETWAPVISEGGLGIDVARIPGGFAAISFSTASNTRRMRVSYDGGKNWQPIDDGLPGQASGIPLGKRLSPVNPGDSSWNPNNSGLPEEAFITSIVQVGKYFFCGHPSGILRSADKGKTWTRVLPSVGNKVFNLSVSGDVIYAIPRNAGC